MNAGGLGERRQGNSGGQGGRHSGGGGAAGGVLGNGRARSQDGQEEVGDLHLENVLWEVLVFSFSFSFSRRFWKVTEPIK